MDSSRGRSGLALAIAALVALAPCARAGAEPRSLQIDPLVDGSITVAGAVLLLPLYLGHIPEAEAAVPLAGREPPGGLDGLAPLKIDPSIARASDAVLLGTLAAGLGAVTALGIDRGQAGPLLLIFAETLVLDAALNEMVKRAVDRPRPYSWGEGSAQGDALRSFYSGHAALTAGAAFGAVRLLDLTTELEAWQLVGLYGLAGALTVAAALLRVAAGMHFPTDVLVGAVVGASVGLLVPTLHLSRDQSLGTQTQATGLQAGFAFRF